MKKIIFLIMIIILLLSCTGKTESHRKPEVEVDLSISQTKDEFQTKEEVVTREREIIKIEKHNIWGFWDEVGREGWRKRQRGSSIGEFDVTPFFFSLDPEDTFFGGPRISTIDESHPIKKIIPDANRRNIIYLILGYEEWTVVYGEIIAPTEIFTVKVAMHFIDIDHMWFETVWNDYEYPTDPRFPPEYFKGQSEIFRRVERAE
jgi:hypothetical protein